MIFILTILIFYFAAFIGIRILRHKLRKYQREAEDRANQGRTQYADGQIFYQRNSGKRKWFSDSDGEYVDYEEVK